MSRSSEKWSYERYALALRGHDDMPALRRTVKGFTSDDGYDLRKFDKWTPARKKRVRYYYDAIHNMLAQERVVLYPRNKAKRDALQFVSHGEYANKMWKAVLVPYVAPIGSDGKRVTPKILFTPEGVKFKTGSTAQSFVPFNQTLLASDPEKELRRVLRAMGDVNYYFIRVNEFQTLNANSKNGITQQVLKWREKYNGVAPLTTGRHRGENPANHHYSEWMKALVGFSTSPEDEDDMYRRFLQGRENSLKRRALADASIKKVDLLMKEIRRITDKHDRKYYTDMARDAGLDSSALAAIKRAVLKYLKARK